MYMQYFVCKNNPTLVSTCLYYLADYTAIRIHIQIPLTGYAGLIQSMLIASWSTRKGMLKGTNGRQNTYEIFYVYCIFFSGFMC